MSVAAPLVPREGDRSRLEALTRSTSVPAGERARSRCRFHDTHPMGRRTCASRPSAGRSARPSEDVFGADADADEMTCQVPQRRDTPEHSESKRRHALGQVVAAILRVQAPQSADLECLRDAGG